MIIIDKTLVSDDVLEKQFVCSLEKCKGACCVEGDSGAPLDWEETMEIEKVYDEVKPYMAEEGIATVEKYGKWVVDSEGDFVTPLVKGVKQCAYTFFENGIAHCAFEKAFKEGKSDFRKPVSCHLYPIRITKYENYDAVNYNHWNICSPGCVNGKSLGIATYQFVKDALIRKYGEEWYKQLEGAAKYKKEMQKQAITE